MKKAIPQFKLSHFLVCIFLIIGCNSVFSQEKFRKWKIGNELYFPVKLEVASNNGFAFNAAIGPMYDFGSYSFVTMAIYPGFEVNFGGAETAVGPKVGLEFYFENDLFFERLPMYLIRGTYFSPYNTALGGRNQYFSIDAGLSIGTGLYLCAGYVFEPTSSVVQDLEGFRMSLGVNMDFFTK